MARNRLDFSYAPLDADYEVPDIRTYDLSSVHNIADFAEEMGKVAVECFRVLKPGKHYAILMGDTRRSKHFVPITPGVTDELS